MNYLRFSRFVPVALFVAACGGPLTYDLVSTPKAPGADAHLVADVNEDQNQTQVELTIVNLAPPDRVAASTSHYLVWYRADSSKPWSRVAAVEYDEDARAGELKGSVPETAFELVVTAEASLEAVSPSPNIVFSQAVAE